MPAWLPGLLGSMAFWESGVHRHRRSAVCSFEVFYLPLIPKGGAAASSIATLHRRAGRVTFGLCSGLTSADLLPFCRA